MGSDGGVPINVWGLLNHRVEWCMRRSHEEVMRRHISPDQNPGLFNHVPTKREEEAGATQQALGDREAGDDTEESLAREDLPCWEDQGGY